MVTTDHDPKRCQPTTTRSKPLRDEEGFLERWSRRKAEAGVADCPPEADSSKSSDLKKSPPHDHVDGQPAFDISSLPDIDDLGPGSDFTPFMQIGVPPALKTKALRKLWRVKPELANLDGLVDYGDDLTGSFKVVDHLKTAYEVGRGFLKELDMETGDDQRKDDSRCSTDMEETSFSSDHGRSDPKQGGSGDDRQAGSQDDE